jgi:hypothetical protein
MFISQLFLYFVDYLLMLLNTMCIYPFMLFSAKVQNHPCSSEIGRNLRKIQKIPSKAAQPNES